MALDANPAYKENTLINDVLSEKLTPQQLITAKAIPASVLNQLPDEIRRKLRNQAWSLIPPRQSDLFRYQHSAMFWVKTNKHWQQVNYAQYRHHSGERYAFAPYQPLEVDNNTPKFAGGGSANNAINPITSQVGQITSAVQSALATNNASTSSNGSTSANTLANSQNNKRGLTQAEINQRFLGASVDPEQALEPHVFISKPYQGEQIELKKSAQVYMRFSQHTMTPADTVESVAKQYTGQADAGLVYPYNFNEGFTRRNPPQAGDTIKVPSGWDTHVEGSVTNASSVEVSWQGASSGSEFISLPKPPPDQMRFSETRLTLDPGTYQLTAVANGAEHSIEIEVLEAKKNQITRVLEPHENISDFTFTQTPNITPQELPQEQGLNSVPVLPIEWAIDGLASIYGGIKEGISEFGFFSLQTGKIAAGVAAEVAIDRTIGKVWDGAANRLKTPFKSNKPTLTELRKASKVKEENLQVEAVFEHNGQTFYDVNQTARNPQNATGEPLPIYSEKRVERGKPNNTTADAHAEIAALGQSYLAGNRGGSAVLTIHGQDACNFCRTDLKKMANELELESLKVIQPSNTVTFENPEDFKPTKKGGKKWPI
ncbi:hypothetical protein DXX93_17190 [Thalassotalea euphylliae]|uniref:Putative cytidine deaminase C-terminal domain-containing protein n=1 Tax=Thalassotalea euphylliae TaxID=1655234 RepID=A0A3E0TUT0_9GAMM|nr:hypothetical protein [Thalassotalea euphylliae]REL28127.1 hypothetical protein DXX93_17190 [Thalassotalea euphylliae]